MAKLYPDYYDEDESIRPDPDGQLPADVRRELDGRAHAGRGGSAGGFRTR